MKLSCVVVPMCFGVALAMAQVDPTPPVPLEPANPNPSADPAGHGVAIEMPHAVPQPITLRVVGSNVKNLMGEYLGRIENIVIDGESGRAEYAALLLNYPTNTSRYTPVPWGKLTYVWDQSQAAGVPGALQVFLLNLDRATLERAPSVDRSQWSAIRRPDFANQIAAFYGLTDTAAIGAPDTASGTVTGAAYGTATGLAPGGALTGPTSLGGAGRVAAADGILTPGVDYPFFVSPGFFVVDTNFAGTNVVLSTNVVITNIGGITTNVVINLTNFPPGTNIVGGGTNIPSPFATNTPLGGILSFTNGQFQFRGPLTSRSATEVPGTQEVPAVGAPTGRSATTGTPFIGPVAPAPAVPPQGAAAPRLPLPSTVAPPGTVAPQVPPPPASPIIPTIPGSAQRPSLPSSAAPPGTVAPQVPTTPPAAVPPAPQQR